ncbi:MAG: Flp pilus assembly protein CpaB [Chloroflexi bacterium]|nr:Flp pilus assembly protein CpaB [Chloroflexota bacterium]
MGRLRGCLWLTAGLVVAVLAGAVAFITLQRATTLRSTGEGVSGPRVPVVVAARAVEVRSQLTAEDLELKDLPVEAAPQGAVGELAGAVGKITLVDLYPGEVILAQRLLDPDVITGDGRLALVIAEDKVLMAFPAQDLMSQVGVLKPGDHVDLLFSLDFPVNRGVEEFLLAEGEAAESGATGGTQEEEQATFNLLQNVTIAAIVTRKTPTGGEAGVSEALLVTVSPQDALLLKYAKDAGGIVDIVLRAPGAERPFSTEPVDVDYMIYRYRIPTEIGR